MNDAEKWEVIKEAFFADRDAVTDRYNYVQRCCVFTEKMRSILQGKDITDFIIYEHSNESRCPWCNSKGTVSQIGTYGSAEIDKFKCSSCGEELFVTDSGVVINRV